MFQRLIFDFACRRTHRSERRVHREFHFVEINFAAVSRRVLQRIIARRIENHTAFRNCRAVRLFQYGARFYCFSAHAHRACGNCKLFAALVFAFEGNFTPHAVGIARLRNARGNPGCQRAANGYRCNFDYFHFIFLFIDHLFSFIDLFFSL